MTGMELPDSNPDKSSPPAPVSEHTSGRGASSTIVKNAAIVTAATLLLKGINFIYNVLVVRRLGDSGYGQYATVTTFVGLFAIFAELGISQYSMREMARHPEQTNNLFWNLVAVRLGLASLGIIAITLAAVIFGYPTEIIIGVAFYTLTFVWSAVQAPIEALLAANEQFKYVSAMSIIGRVATMILGGIVLVNDWGFLPLIGMGLLAMLPPTLFGAWAVHRSRLLDGKFPISPRGWPTLIRSGLPFGMISLALTISFTVDSVMLSRTQPPEVVGWYNAAYNLTGSLLFIFGGLSVAMVPTLTKAYWTDTGLVHRWYARSVKFILLLGLPMATGGSLVALPLFLFLYGESFTPAAFTFKIIVWDVPLLLFTSFSGNMTTIVGEERAAARIYFTAAAANVALNLVLIPAYSLYGAAVATVLTDIVAAVQFYLLLGRKLRLPNLSSVAARVALACGVMAASLLLLQTLGAALWLLILSGVLVYGAMIVVTRLLDADEQRLLRRAVSQMGRLHT